MTTGDLAQALAQTFLLLTVGWAVGHLLVTKLPRFGWETGGPEKALFAIFGAIVFAVVAMVGHLATGGGVFGSSWVVPALALVAVVAGRGGFTSIRLGPWGTTVLLAAFILALYLVPVLLGGSGVRTGDPPWHLGWSEQLLAGDRVPTGPAPELGRNAYPWGWHALIATLVRLVPGSTPLIAHEALHLMLLMGLPLGAACVARRVISLPGTGWFAAAAASLIGGFGWISARTADFVTSPTQARHGADLVVASPNSVYELLPPALPREMGLVALAAAACLLAVATTSFDPRLKVLAGIAVGVVGLISVPLFVSALLWSAIAIAMSKDGRRWNAGLVLIPALLVFALWAGPVVVSYLRFDGFVNITPELGKEWPLFIALSAWGLLVPLVIAGIVFVRRGVEPEGRVVFGYVIGTAILLGFAIARRAFEWDLAGNATLLHQGRVWPPAHLLGAALAGVGLAEIFRALRERSRTTAIVATSALLGAGAVSPVFASITMSDILERDAAGFVYARPDLDDDSFVMRAAERLGPDDTVDVRGPDELGFLLFQFSGTTLAHYDDPRLEGNELRIRFDDLAAEWDRRAALDDFEADYRVMRTSRGAGEAVATGTYEGDRWALVSTDEPGREERAP